MSVGWRRLSTESAGVGEKRLWRTGLGGGSSLSLELYYITDLTTVFALHEESAITCNGQTLPTTRGQTLPAYCLGYSFHPFQS